MGTQACNPGFKLEAGLDCIVRPCLKIQKENEKERGSGEEEEEMTLFSRNRVQNVVCDVLWCLTVGQVGEMQVHPSRLDYGTCQGYAFHGKLCLSYAGD